jgi:inosine/xanthosine triphosphatase
VRRALARLVRLDARLWEGAEILSVSADSGVRATPLSDTEMRRGAQQRTRALQERLQREGRQADFLLGLEGGLHVEDDGDQQRVWLRSWAYATDGGRGAWGCSPTLEVPADLAQGILRGEDLARLIDRVTGEHDVRSQGGTWGYVTSGLIDRTDAFEAAVLAAMARFYNRRAYDG